MPRLSVLSFIILSAGAMADAPAPLRVLRALPEGDAGPMSTISVSFDRPIAASLEGITADPGRILTITPAVAGKAEWRDPVTLRFTPTAPLAAGTSYTVSLDTTFTSMDGARLAAPYRYSFRVRGPKVLVGLPVGPGYYGERNGNSSQLIAPRDTFFLIVSRPVTAGQVDQSVFIETDRTCSAGRRVIKMTLAQQVAIPREAPWQFREAGGYGRDRRADSLRRQVALVPKESIPLDCGAGLVLPSFFDPEGGELPGRFPFRTYPPLAIVPCREAGKEVPCQAGPTGPISVRFTTPVRGSEVQRHLRIVPEARVMVDDTTRESTSWEITQDPLKPRTGYAVMADTLLRDVFGQRLSGNPVTVAATTGYAPSIDYDGGRMLVEKAGYRTLAVRHVNLDTLFVDIRPISDSLYAEVLRRGPWGWGGIWTSLDSTGGVRAVPVSGPRDGMMVTGVALPVVDATKPRPPAAFAVKVRGNVPADKVANAWSGAVMAVVQVTDLAVTSRAGGSEATIWVTGASDGRVRPGARVELHAGSGALVAQGTTDTGGIVRFTNVRGLVPTAGGNENGEEECEYECGGSGTGGAYVTVRLGADRAVLGVNESAYDLSPWQFNAYSAYGLAKEQVAATIFTERDIYRPGEPVYAKAIVRNGPLGALTPPRRDSVKLTFQDRDGGELRSSVIRLSEFGTAQDSIVLPAGAKLGYYNVAVSVYRQGRWQQASTDGYRVAEYRAPEFLVHLTADSGARFPGDSLTTSIEARYLFGAPMGRAAVKWTTRLTRGWIWSGDIPGLGDGWYLGATGYWYERDGRGEVDVTAEGTDTLDAAGRLVLKTPIGLPSKGRPGLYTIEATVVDVNRQSVAASATVKVHPASFYIAAKPSGEYFWTGGKLQRIDVVAIRPDGRKVSGVAVRGTVIRREWHQVSRARYGYSEVVGEWVEDTVARCDLRTAEAPVNCGITPASGGSYIVRFTATDEAGREVATSFYRWATGAGWEPWYDESRFKMDIIPDRQRYAPGDTATLLIASPFTNAEAWVTIEREGILEQRRIHITDGATRIRVPITERHVPNIFVSAVVVRGRSGPPGTLDDPGRPTLRVGYTELTVLPDVKRMQVTVTPERPEYRPGDTATIRLTTRTTTGGVRSEVTLWAVDEGVLSLTGFKTPDPLERIYAARGLGLTLSSNLTTVAPQVLRAESRQLKGLRNAGQGGGEEDADVLRSRFQTTAFFLGSVITDSSGAGVARVKLPDNLTTFRVMAVAVSRNDRYGSADAPLLVTRPLLARPALPRFFRPGDEFLAGVVVNQRAGGTPTVGVDVTATGVTLGGPSHQNAVLEAGRGKEVRFPFTGLAGDSASFRFDVAGEGDRDAVLTRLPVRPDHHPRARTVAGMLYDTATVTITLPAGTDPARTWVEIAAGSSPFAMLRGLDREYRLYDWYCTEQVVSVATPLLELWKAQQLGADSVVRSDAKARLEKAIATIVRRVRPDGAIDLWDNGRWTSAWLTGYAGTFLAEAKKVGFAVDQGVLDNAARYLAARARDNSTLAGPVAYWQDDVQGKLRERLAAADFMSRMGQPDLSTENELVRSAPLLAWEDRIWLAQVLARRGAVRNARTLLEPVWREVRIEGNRAVLADSLTRRPFYFYSRIRPLARLLTATMAVDSTHELVGPLVQTLIGRGRVERARGYWWWNTQDVAFAASALAEFGKRQRSAVGRGVAVTVAGRPFMTLAAGDTVATRTVTNQGYLPPVGGDSVRLTLRLNAGGTGAGLFYAVTVHEVPKAQPTTPDDRGIRVERWYESLADNKPIGTVTEGQLVRVRVRVTVPSERQFVVVEDPLPAGLEAVDLSLRTEARQGVPAGGEECASYNDEESRPNGWSWYYGSWEGCYWSPFDHKELRDDRVVWVATVLWRGTYTLSYTARATTSGKFKRSTAWAEEMYNPGLNGRSEGGVFEVRQR
ncbi:MAG TPA: MG2 domain-containing protein [Gemmatimonadales bacterium]|nr:MG2 domain-containing protein [Gemmatimonadales bacterium]